MTAQRIEDADTRAPGDPRPPPHDAAPVMLPNEARQGRPVHRVRYILGIGLAAVVVALAVIYFGYTPSPGG